MTRAPLVSVVIPTHDRPESLGRAIESVLASTIDDLEVVVVDDASDPPAVVPDDPRVRLVRLDRNEGNAAARNAGIEAARGTWLAFCDDDDRWRPHLLEQSLAAIAASDLPAPVAAISGIAVVDDGTGEIVDHRHAVSHPRGDHFFLEVRGGTLTKQTLVVELEVLRAVGGFDESFASRVWTDLFLRLNPVCSLQGVPTVAYELHRHDGPRVSTRTSLRAASVARLLERHEHAFRTHPDGAARFLVDHAHRSLTERRPVVALRAVARAATHDPVTTVRAIAGRIRRQVRPPAAPRGERRHRVELVATAPLGWASGYQYLLPAVARTIEDGLDVGLTITAADADPDDRERLLFDVFDLGLGRHVRLGTIIDDADVHVDASLAPRRLAPLAARVVATTSVDGPAQAVRVPPADVDALAGAIRAAAGAPSCA